MRKPGTYYSSFVYLIPTRSPILNQNGLNKWFNIDHGLVNKTAVKATKTFFHPTSEQILKQNEIMIVLDFPGSEFIVCIPSKKHLIIDKVKDPI